MKRKLSNDEIASLCLELSLLLHAGVSTGDALSLLAQEEEHRGMLSAMAEQVDGGKTLSTALRESGVFPVYVCGLVEVGERTGRTEEALAALSRYYEERVRIGRRVRSALLYPAVMLALMLVVIGVLLVKVLPIFDDVYASLGGRLTGVAAGLLNLGRWIEGAMPVLYLILAGLVLAVLVFGLVGPLRRGVVSLWQKTRGDRGVSRKLNNARLAQALAMGMASGLPVEEAVSLSANLMEGRARKRCQECGQRLEKGESLGAALRLSGLLPPPAEPPAGAGPAQRRGGRLHGEDRPGPGRGGGGRPGRPGGPGGACPGAGLLGAGGADPAVGDAAPHAHHERDRVTPWRGTETA